MPANTDLLNRLENAMQVLWDSAESGGCEEGFTFVSSKALDDLRGVVEDLLPPRSVASAEKSCPKCGRMLVHYVDTEHSSIPDEGWRCSTCGYQVSMI